MSSANEHQIGGAHYKTVYQHWDLVADCQLGYFEGQISKYLSRHRLKNGLQDVEKAEHFLMKLLELARNGYPAFNGEATTTRVTRYFEANSHIDINERQVIMAVCFWSRTKHIEPAMKLLHRIKQEYIDADKARELDQGYPDGTPDHPTPGGYVDQGKDEK